MSELVQIQETFADAVLNPSASVPACVSGATRRCTARRFAVYRNNVAAGLVSALGARFPVVKRLVGTEFFRAMATAYIRQEPPRTPVLIYYGDTFPTFIDSFEPAAPVPYLGDVARLELARGLAYHAADVRPVSAADFTALPLDRLEDVRVRLHPSASVVSSHYPVFSIWRVNHNPDRVVPISPWAPESALIARPILQVDTRPISGGTAIFIQMLAKGQAMGQALLAAVETSPKFDASEGVAVLIAARIVIGFGYNVGAMRRN